MLDYNDKTTNFIKNTTTDDLVVLSDKLYNTLENMYMADSTVYVNDNYTQLYDTNIKYLDTVIQVKYVHNIQKDFELFSISINIDSKVYSDEYIDRFSKMHSYYGKVAILRCLSNLYHTIKGDLK